MKLEHFRTSRHSGDVDLLLGIDSQSMHPKPIVSFNENVSICIIRQPVQGQRFLILTGSTKEIDNLDGRAVETDQVLHIRPFRDIPDEENKTVNRMNKKSIHNILTPNNNTNFSTISHHAHQKSDQEKANVDENAPPQEDAREQRSNLTSDAEKEVTREDTLARDKEE